MYLGRVNFSPCFGPQLLTRVDGSPNHLPSIHRPCTKNPASVTYIGKSNIKAMMRELWFLFEPMLVLNCIHILDALEPSLESRWVILCHSIGVIPCYHRLALGAGQMSPWILGYDPCTAQWFDLLISTNLYELLINHGLKLLTISMHFNHCFAFISD